MSKNFNYALIFAVILQFVGLVWYLSKVDSRVSILYDKFEKESEQDVVENQVKMKLDLANLIEDVKQIKKDLRQSNKKDKEIMDQHRELFNLLESGSSSDSSYSYGN
jgi:flagellar biosynthesis/type III secretory pathway chaperone